MKRLGIIALIVLVITSCKKPEDRRCWKSAGEETTKEVQVLPFNSLFLGPHINFVLVQDTEEKVVITGGKNLVNFITTDVVDGKLSIRNTNKCNFLRSYDKQITVEVHLIDVEHIEYEGSKPLTCQNQLNLNDLLIEINEGAGEFNLDINCNTLRSNVTKGWGNMVVTGDANYARFTITSNGFMNSYGLNVQDSLHVISKTPGLIKVNADNALFRSETNVSGDIWYIGVPSLIDHNQYGEGELIDKN